MSDDARYKKPDELTDGELLAELHESYRPEVIPPCRVCGGKLSVQSMGGGPTIWACSGMIDDPKDKNRVVYAKDRRPADKHYNDSRYTQYRHSDGRVLELIRRFQARIPVGRMRGSP